MGVAMVVCVGVLLVACDCASGIQEIDIKVVVIQPTTVPSSVTAEVCCDLGAKMAKHSQPFCTWSFNLVRYISQINRYWNEKSRWTGAKPAAKMVSGRLLHKCKRHKGFYEKCCMAEKLANEHYIEKMLARLPTAPPLTPAPIVADPRGRLDLAMAQPKG